MNVFVFEKKKSKFLNQNVRFETNSKYNLRKNYYIRLKQIIIYYM